MNLRFGLPVKRGGLVPIRPLEIGALMSGELPDSTLLEQQPETSSFLAEVNLGFKEYRCIEESLDRTLNLLNESRHLRESSVNLLSPGTIVSERVISPFPSLVHSLA